MILLLLAVLTLPPDEPWLTVDAGGFHIISNAAPAEIQKIARELAGIAHPTLPATVIIFRDVRSFAAYRDALFQRIGAPNAGVYLGGSNEILIITQADAGLDPVRHDIATHLPRGQLTEIPTPKPLDRAEMLATLGHVLARARKETAADADVFIEEALRINSKLPLAYADRAHLEQSDTMYERAIALPDANALTYVLYGADVLDRFNTTRSKSDVALARRVYERAAQIDPASPRALAGLGATYVVSDENPAPGIAALEKSLSLLPGQDDVAVNLMRLYVRVDRRADAQRLFDTVVSKSAEPSIVKMGRDALERQQRIAEEKAQTDQQVTIVEQAMAKANAGKYSEALKMIDDVLRDIKDEEFRGSVTRLREEIYKKSLSPQSD